MMFGVLKSARDALRLCVITALTIPAATVSFTAIAGPLAIGDYEIASRRADAPVASRAINGNSQIEDVSRDGRYIVFNTEGSYTTATRGNAKSLIVDRQTGETQLLDPDPRWHSSNLMLHDTQRYATFVSTSPNIEPDPANESLEQYGDLFTWDRQNNTYVRHTSGWNIPIEKERTITMSRDGERVLFYTGNSPRPNTGRTRRGHYLFERSTNKFTHLNDFEGDPTQSWFINPGSPVLSGSGEWLVHFEALREGPFDDKTVFRNLDTNERVVLDTNGAIFLSLTFDGSKLLFIQTDPDESSRSLYQYTRGEPAARRFLPNANAPITSAVYSGDGRFIFFETTATNLVSEPDPSGGAPDMYRLNVGSGVITRITRLKPGGISPYSVNFDGSVVAFEDDANIYDAGDPNGGYSDVFVWADGASDFPRVSNTVEPYTLIGANGDSDNGVISAEGRFVAFTSAATNLLDSEDTNGVDDLFLHDRDTGVTRNITAASNSDIRGVVMSASGQELLFLSTGDNLGSGRFGDGNNLYLYDSSADQITNLTPIVRTQGDNWDILPTTPAISADGNRALFHTTSGVKVWDRSAGNLLELPTGTVTFAQLDTNGTVAMLETPIGSRSVIELYDVDTQQLVDSTTGRADAARMARMSDDAQRLLFYSFTDVISNDGQVERGLYLWDRGTDSFRYLGYTERNVTTTEPFAISRDGTVAVLQSHRFCNNPNGRQVFYLDTQVAEELACVIDAPQQGFTNIHPALSGNGDFLLGETLSRYVQTDVNSRINLYVQRLAGVQTDNAAPEVANLQATTIANRPVAITLAGTDADGDPLTYQIIDAPTAGTLSGTPPELTYTPNPNYTGTDSFTYTANDGQSSSSTALVSLTIVAESVLSFTAVQRPDSRTIDINATWPSDAQWTQVRVWDEFSTVLWDGQALQWSGAYTPSAQFSEISFNSRYWVGGVEMGNTTITVTLRAPDTGLTLTGYAWIDSNADSIRDASEPGDVGRDVALYRCKAPWGLVSNSTSMAPDGRFQFTNLEAGEYQIGTPATGVEFTPLGNDNVVFANGFSGCITVDGTQREIGIGLRSAALPSITVNGFAWRDINGDSLRSNTEQGDANRTVTMYRCKAPWGIAGTAVTDTQGNFAITDVLPGEYQFGTPAEGVRFSPVRRDNLIYANGFSNCIDFNAGPRRIGIGVLE